MMSAAGAAADRARGICQRRTFSTNKRAKCWSPDRPNSSCLRLPFPRLYFPTSSHQHPPRLPASCKRNNLTNALSVSQLHNKRSYPRHSLIADAQTRQITLDLVPCINLSAPFPCRVSTSAQPPRASLQLESGTPCRFLHFHLRSVS